MASRLIASVFLGALLLAASGCTPIPQQGGLAVSAGPISDQWSFQWDPALRTPIAMRNRVLQDESTHSGDPISDAEAETAVRTLFRDHRDWFRLRPGFDDIQVARSNNRGWLKFLRTTQTYKGILIAGAGYDVSVVSGGRVASLEGRFYPEIEMNVAPVLNAAQAADRARGAFSGGSINPPSVPQFQYEYETGFRDPALLTILPQGGTYVLTWATVIRTPPEGSARVYVDANNGTVLGYQRVGTDWQR